MTYLETSHRQHHGILNLILTAVIAAAFGMLVGVQIELPHQPSTQTQQIDDLPDWHGNVKRSWAQ